MDLYGFINRQCPDICHAMGSVPISDSGTWIHLLIVLFLSVILTVHYNMV